MTWTGKMRLRCGDFHARHEIDGYVYSWYRITPEAFAYTLASNFCYLTDTPGFTPEPIDFPWQRKITAEIKKQLTPEAIKKREKRNARVLIRTGVIANKDVGN